MFLKQSESLLKTIAIVTPKIDTFTNPTLSILIEKLLEKNFKILFFGYEQLFIPKDIIRKIDYHQLPLNFYTLKKNPNSIAKLLSQVRRIRKLFRKENDVKALLCVDPMGLVIAGRIKRIVPVKLLYASFEIFFKDEFLMDRKKILKDLEIEYSRKADAVIVQDEDREKLLRDSNDFPAHSKFFRIPVSPAYFKVTPGKYGLRKKLGIPEDKVIVVYSGTLQNWSGINEILELFPDHWDPDFRLVIHSHHRLSDSDPVKIRLDELQKANQQVSYHDYPFYEFKDYADFLSECNIGIAAYVPREGNIFAGKNLSVIGLSSGKFSTYMMLGIPAITTDNIPYKELNKKYKFGEVVDSISMIPGALKKIRERYTEYQQGCKKLYNEVLNPEDKINEFIKYVDTIYK